MPIEEVYAAHSNSLKALANQARKATLTVGKHEYSPSAAKTYHEQVSSLNHKLNEALKHSPKERQAQIIAGVSAKARIEANPGIDDSDIKKIRQQELTKVRARLGAKKPLIEIEPDEWEAIQAGAVSANKLNEILAHANQETVRKRATPRAATVMTASKLAIAKARLASGYTQAEVAESLGVPVSTLESAIKR
jgi:DNA-binding transcriptional regulator YiaG